MVSGSILIGVLLLTAMVGTAVTGLCWRHRHRPGGYPLFLLMAAVTWWTAAYLGELMAPTLGAKLFWARLQWLGSMWVPVLWLVFALEFTGHGDQLTRRRIGLLAVVPALSIALVWTNAAHGLIRRNVGLATVDGLLLLEQTWGPGFWVAIGYTYLLAFVGSFLLLRLALQSSALFRDQIAAMLVAALAPWIGNLLYISGVGVLGGVDPTPMAFTVTGVASLGAITRFRLLGVSAVPERLVGELVLSGMQDGVVVVDTEGRIADLNPAASEIVDVVEPIGEPAESLIPGYSDSLDRHEDGRTVVAVGASPSERYFDVRGSAVTDHRDRQIGTVVVLRDVTEARRHQQRLDVLNRVLRHNLRNEMNVLTGYAESVRVGDIEAERFADLVEDRASNVVDLGEKARTIEEMLGDGTGSVDVETTLDRVIDTVAASHDGVQITIEDRPDPIWSADWALEPILESLVENAAEHNRGANPRVTVEASVEDRTLTVTIADTGPGLPDVERDVMENLSETPSKHGRGLGLWLASWGVRELGGTLDFQDRAPRGTLVVLEVPVRRRSLPAAEGEEGETAPTTHSATQ